MSPFFSLNALFSSGVSSRFDGTVVASGYSTKGQAGPADFDAFVISFIAGDVNCDGVVKLLDVGPFIDALNSSEYSIKADINGDGATNLLDVGPFVNLLSG